METARISKSGRSQVIRLPESYQFAGTEVALKRLGNGVLLLPIDNPWQPLVASSTVFETGFTLAREQPGEPVGKAQKP